MPFKLFAEKVNAQFNKLAEHDLFLVDTDNDTLWNTYLEAYPEGTNEIFRVNREHDCSCCRTFIKEIAGVVSIIDNEVHTMWSFDTSDLSPTYQEVVEQMRTLVASLPIMSAYLRNANHGTKISQVLSTEHLEDGGEIKWNHFYCVVPDSHSSANKAELVGRMNSASKTFKRGLEELSTSSLNTVEDLINENSLYRGTEHKQAVTNFLAAKIQYEQAENKPAFIWANYKANSGFRNSVIGTLVQDISNGMDLENAVSAFEAKVAPTNYKRSSSIITKGMIEQATKTIAELDLEPSLQRRHANLTDISVNDVLFADHAAQAVMKDPLTDLLMAEVKSTTKVPSKVTDISWASFLADVLPKSDTISVLMDNKHVPNLVNITTAMVDSSKSPFKWDNNFAWSYNGGLADSMKERVKELGGKVDGVLRFSIQWNEETNDQSNDLDAHCYGPAGHIYYGRDIDNTGGRLDVDVRRPQSKVAVENITWPSLSHMKDGTYAFNVHNFSGTNVGGFRAEIEFDGQVTSFSYDRPVKNTVAVATVTLAEGKFSIESALDSTAAQKTVWNVSTNTFIPVDTIMFSPNMWESGNQQGNKHLFFLLRDCNNPESTRGMYNEFLRGDLHKHRKVFEVLGSKMKVEPVPLQLAGLGFSTTQSNELTVQVRGNVNGNYRITF